MNLGSVIRAPVDKLIETFLPGWGLRRGLARYNLDRLRGQMIAGEAVNDQQKRLRRRVLSVAEDVRLNRAIDLQVARSLMARNSWAVGAVNSITGNVIGRGMRLESVIEKKSGANEGQLDRKMNDRIELEFEAWARTADLTGKKSLMTIQRQAYKERWISNDVFIRRHIDPDKRIPLSLEVVAGEQLSDRTEGNTKQGIEFDTIGKPVAYHFFTSETDRTLERVPAKNVIHIFKPHRPGAIRGLSPMSPVANSFEALSKYLNHELTRAGIASAFVFMHKTGGTGITGLQTGDGADQTDDYGNPVVNVAEGGGVMLKGGPNDSLESVAPAIQSTAFDPFVRLILRSIATGLGISYELMARDFTKTNFSSSRSSQLEDRRQWEPEQQEFVNEVLIQIFDWFVEDARTAGVFPFTQARKVWPVVWTPQGWQWIDPMKDAQATELAIGMGIDNPIDAARRQGRDLGENLKKKALAESMAEEAGTTINTGGNTGASTDVDDEDETEEGEEGTEGEGDGPTPRRVA